MNIELQKYLQSLSNKNNTDKADMITNIGLLLEKNNGYNNPTDYSLLLPEELLCLSITTDDREKIIDCLLVLLKQEPVYSSRIVWTIGKTFNENYIESMLSTILQINTLDNDTFEQIDYIVEVTKNERIIKLFEKINSLRDRNLS